MKQTPGKNLMSLERPEARPVFHGARPGGAYLPFDGVRNA